MGEEVRMDGYHPHACGNDGDEERVTKWEIGLPNGDDLTPLSQALIPPELASAFSISPVPHWTDVDVNRESQNTLQGLRGGQLQGLLSNNLKSFDENESRDCDPMVIQGDETDGDGSGSDSRKFRKIDSAEEADSELRTDNSIDDQLAQNLKRHRLVWTPQLHKRFVDVVAHLGIKNAVPKTIMQLMNVEGLTRENVASHLQKYRLYLKRMRGFSNEGMSLSDQLFASTSVQQSLNDGNASAQGNRDVPANGDVPVPIPIPYAPPMMHMPMYGVAHGHMGMPVGKHGGAYYGFESHPFNMMLQRDWSGNAYGSVGSYPHAAPNEK